jgi:hypothetical protein
MDLQGAEQAFLEAREVGSDVPEIWRDIAGRVRLEQGEGVR